MCPEGSGEEDPSDISEVRSPRRTKTMDRLTEVKMGLCRGGGRGRLTKELVCTEAQPSTQAVNRVVKAGGRRNPEEGAVGEQRGSLYYSQQSMVVVFLTKGSYRPRT